MNECEICGGSGVLNVEVANMHSDLTDEMSWTREASWCHHCPQGKIWEELLNG